MTHKPTPNKPEIPDRYRHWAYWRNELIARIDSFLSYPSEAHLEQLMADARNYQRHHATGQVKAPYLERSN